jgi:hypothetical protein
LRPESTLNGLEVDFGNSDEKLDFSSIIIKANKSKVNVSYVFDTNRNNLSNKNKMFQDLRRPLVEVPKVGQEPPTLAPYKLILANMAQAAYQ